MPAISLGVIYFALFKHKWLILAFAVLGLAAAVGVRKFVKPPYYSEARLLIRYVEERQHAIGEDASRTVSPGGRGNEGVLQTEINILTSYDLALEVASQVGPAIILDELSGDPQADLRRAAGMVHGGLSASAPRFSAVITVGFTHPSAGAVQPVLRQVIATYLKRHADVHRNVGDFDATLVQETDQRRSKLLQVEDEIRRLLEQAGVIELGSARTENATRASRLQEELLSTEAELAELRAQIAAFHGVAVPEPTQEAAAPEKPVDIPADTLAAYRQTLARLPGLQRREQELLAQFTPNSPPVRGVRTQIDELEAVRTRIEREYPQIISQMPAAVTAPATGSGSVAAAPGAFDPAAAAARVSAIEARRKVTMDQLKRVREESARLTALEATITELQRSKELQEQQYRYLSTNLERARMDEALGPGRVSNINELQSPRPPSRDMKKVNMAVLGLAAGGFVLGIGLALAIELFLDQRVKRPAEVEAQLGLPLIMTMPRAKTIASLGKSHQTPRLGDGKKPGANGATEPSNGALVPWAPGHELRDYFDALRNRLIYNFEMRNITRKPKLVAVTGCGPSSGVSTVAAGLAASLSETGDGNVLLVDMNPDRATPQHFQRGSLKVGIDDVLAQDTRDDAMVRENLYMVSQGSVDDRLSLIVPKRFAQLVPKMKASDFDYIIFDMPPVSQVSATPQLARYMDQVLMVVESEKTPRDAVRRAGSMLTEVNPNVSVVLNKTRQYVPAALDSGAMSS